MAYTVLVQNAKISLTT